MGRPVDRARSGPATLLGGAPVLNTTIMLFLLQDGITNGAIYALLGLALVLVGLLPDVSLASARRIAGRCCRIRFASACAVDAAG